MSEYLPYQAGPQGPDIHAVSAFGVDSHFVAPLPPTGDSAIDTINIQNAIAECEATKKMLLLYDMWRLAQHVTITKPFPILGFGRETGFDATAIPPIDGALNYDPAVQQDGDLFSWRNFAIIGGNPLYAVRLDATDLGEFFRRFIIEQLLLSGAKTAILLQGGGAGFSTFTALIKDCLISADGRACIEGIQLLDSVEICGSTLTGNGFSFIGDFVPGAGGFSFHNNSCTGTGGFKLKSGGILSVIEQNFFEVANAGDFTGDDNAIVNLDGIVGVEVTEARIRDNIVTVGNTRDCIRINRGINTVIDGNRLQVIAATTGQHIVQTVNAVGTRIGTNDLY